MMLHNLIIDQPAEDTMTKLSTIEAQAAALCAVNTAKHKSAGKTHRAQMDKFTARGCYVSTHVFYTKGAPSFAAVAKAVGTLSLSASLDTFKVQEL